METQNVQASKSGHYSVMLGSTTRTRRRIFLPPATPAWLGVQAEGQAEQPRIRLLSVPYALKAGDAQTLGGTAGFGLRSGDKLQLLVELKVERTGVFARPCLPRERPHGTTSQARNKPTVRKSS